MNAINFVYFKINLTRPNLIILFLINSLQLSNFIIQDVIDDSKNCFLVYEIILFYVLFLDIEMPSIP